MSRSAAARARNLARGLVAGAAAGLAASLAMDLFQKGWASLAGDDTGSQAKPATLKTADVLARAATGHVVEPTAQAVASEAVHYATGLALGAFYGAAVEFAPAIAAGGGAAFGGVVWLALDEGLVPLLGLAPGPQETAPSDHAYALASHAVFGVSLEVARATMARLLRWSPIAG